MVDHRELLRTLHPDAVVICTPHPSHAAIARDALDSGAHVLIEKPIAIDVADADELLQMSARSGALVAVNFGERFRPSVERARTILASGELGRLIRVSCLQTWRREPAYYQSSPWRGTWRGEGGGVLLNQAPHPLDLLCHLLGSPVRVRGVTRTLRHAIECEDTAQALLEYPGGAVGWVAFSTAELESQRRLEIVGERATLLWVDDLLRVHPTAESTSFPGSAEARRVREELVRDGELDTYLAVHRDLQRAINEHGRPRCDARDALPSLELANAIQLSAARNCAVTLPLERAAFTAYLRDRRAL